MCPFQTVSFCEELRGSPVGEGVDRSTTGGIEVPGMVSLPMQDKVSLANYKKLSRLRATKMWDMKAY